METRKKLVIILPRGESIRNFVYTNIVQNLRKKHIITLVTVKPNGKIWQLLKENSDEIIELKEPKLLYSFSLFQDIFDLAHNRFVWSEAAKVRWNMRDVESKTVASKLIRFTKKILAVFLANQFSMVLMGKIDQSLSLKNESVKQWISFFKNNQVDLVFNTSHSHARIAWPIVYAANNLNIKTATFLFSWDNLTSQGRVIPNYNFYFAWNESIKKDFHLIYPHINKESVIVTGTPQFLGHYQVDKHYSLTQIKSLLGLKSNELYFLYSSGMSNHMPEEPSVVSRIADIIHSINSNYRLVVRTYAKDREDVFDKLKAERPEIIIPSVDWEKNFQTPLIEDQIFFSSLLKHCIAGINVASTISLELCMFDKPAINVGYNPPGKDIYPYDYTRFYNFDHYKPIVESEAIEVAKDEEEMLQLLKDAIQNPAKKKGERAQLIHHFFEGKLGEEVIYEFEYIFEQITFHA
jgi:hypothetical protein